MSEKATPATAAELAAALESTLWVLEHPEVNAIPFCGNPLAQASRIRELLSRYEPVDVTE